MGPGPPGVRHCAQGQRASRSGAKAGTRASARQLQALPAAAVQTPCYTGICFPLGTDESRRACGVVLSELNVPSANENEKLIRFHNHSLRLVALPPPPAATLLTSLTCDLQYPHFV